MALSPTPYCRRCARYRVCRDGVCFACAEDAPIQETLTVHVASESDPKLTYTLHVQGDEITCSCRGYNSHGHCKHQRALRDVLAMEGTKS